MRFPLLVILTGFLTGSPEAGAFSLSEFQEKMRNHVGTLSGKTAASVRMELLSSDKVLFSHQDDHKLIPASNMKLITAAAALEKLGPGFTFETKVYRRGQDLILASNGDPYLVSERLWLLARDVARTGLKKINSIMIGVGAFEETYRGLTEFQDSGEPFTALVSPTALNFNSLEVHVIPKNGEKKPLVEAGPVPSGFAEIQNEIHQGAGSGRSLNVRPQGINSGKEGFWVGGTVGKNSSPATVYGAVSDPERHIASVFAVLLRKEGIAVAKEFGGTVKDREMGGDLIASQESLPLQDLVRLFNTYSNNFMAEQIFLAMGAGDGAASVARSKQAMESFLSRHTACKETQIFNGSGLSWDTRISAHCFTEILRNAYREFRVFADLLGSLPVGGQTGTLKHRFQKWGGDFHPERVRGKTGTLWSKKVATGLTGVTRTASGEAVIFSLLENDERNDPGLLRGLREWEEKCVEFVQRLQL